jgi:hypothetical protein
MKLDVAVNEVVLSNVGTTGEFRIRNSAKAFAILSSGLYSNKIKAIIRELSCNAVDSHVGAGKADVPFEVHLPTFLEPWFAVKDFGLGLDGHQVVNIYTTYFESTKTDSNEFIGALGLGSKSPFSYTENFTVTAIKNGIKRIYSAFINEVGVPSIAEMSEELTDEGNGVEVKFSVTDRYDYNSFRNEAHNVFTWFEHKPTITGVDNFEHSTTPYLEKNIVPGVHTIKGRSCVAVMGNISYPLDNIPEAEKHFGDLRHLLDCGLVLEFGIGDLDFAASREQLSYIPLTIKSIRDKLEALNANLAIHLATKANAITGEWERAFFLYNEQNTTLYKSAVAKYASDTKFALYDPKAYYGKKSFQYTVADLTARGLDMKVFRYRGGVCNRVSESSTHVSGTYTKVREIPVDAEVVIVLNDLNTGCQARAQYHYSNARKYVTVYCVSHSADDLTVRQAEYNKLIAELHNPPVIVKASDLTKRERRTPVSTQGIATISLKSEKRAGYADSYTWTPYTSAIDEDETYYYVCLNNHEPINPDGTTFNMMRIKALMDECGVDGISKINVFGVRKNRIKEIKQLDNWVWIEDILKEETAKVSDEHIASLVASEMLDAYYNKVYTNKKVAKYVGPTSDYAKYVTEMGSIKRASGNVTQLVELCKMYGKSIQVEVVKKRIQDAKDALYKKYPLLKYFKDGSDAAAQEKEIAEYIKLVDKQEKVNE